MARIPDVASAINRKNLREHKEAEEKRRAMEALNKARAKYGQAGDSREKEIKKPKPKGKQSQEYLNAKSAYETAKETGADQDELRRLWRAMKAAEKTSD